LKQRNKVEGKLVNGLLQQQIQRRSVNHSEPDAETSKWYQPWEMQNMVLLSQTSLKKHFVQVHLTDTIFKTEQQFLFINVWIIW